MSREPLVSSIIIFLNAEKFIQEAIESVFAQTYDRWELLLVDDGSTDGSTQIALRYAEQYPEKVRYLEHPGHQNRGMGASRNLGVRHAKGEYIALLDSDDIWLPHKLQQQVAILDSHPGAGMVYGSSQYWNSWTGDPEDLQRDYVPDPEIQTDMLYEPPSLSTLLYPLGPGTSPCPSDLLLRREMIERVGGFEEGFNDIYHLYEDQAFLAKVWLGETVFVASECWDRYRLHPEQCVAVVRGAGHYHSVRLFFFNWLAEYLYKQGFKDIEVWKRLQEVQFRSHSRQLRNLERALKRERRKVRRLRLQVKDMDSKTQDGPKSGIQKLSRRVNRLRTRVLGG
jgi:glycosyltransferase involved in cell wall biosynthesis